ncbi:leucyl aminopeptidase [Propioniferax innocua]|uniref:Probable cytosol aminopeptidase n=1 Tax=Propioniferax innocua TaxID=1753 RepID=A0A542ZR81_9ACTN|nr:leucyl aminopeptidase [Propioniferax innocua]TQL62865.1 leucyl aminopeptidase [Propioniferax innocua]
MTTPAMPALSAAKSLPRNADVVVVGLQGDEIVGVPSSWTKQYAKSMGVDATEMARQLGAKSKLNSTTVLPAPNHRVVVVGLGDVEPTPEQLREAAGSAARAAGSLANGDEGPALNIAVLLPTEEPEQFRAVAEGALLGQYEYAGVRSEAVRPKVARITVVAEADKAQVAEAEAIASAVITAREWVNTPANLLYPETFADSAKSLAAASRNKINVEVLDHEALRRGGYGGIVTVGGGSSREPRLARLSYAPRGASAHLVLVGKGITFDSGGLNLKPSTSMYTMRSDMGGAAAVLAATRAIADLGLKVKVTTYAPMAENMPSHTAYRPSDVLTMYGGTTVENANTDAEGRLVLADALARANADDPDLVVDVATLTGACMVALGQRTFGIFSDDAGVGELLLDAAEVAGEDVWPMPVPEWAREALESKVADIKSSGDRAGGAQQAAAFLRHFVDTDTNWAHLDIAGPGFNDKGPRGYTPSGGTGVAVRTLVEVARSLEG